MHELITTKEFQRKFFKNIPEHHVWQKTPFQIYPLSLLVKHLATPLPLLQANNNHFIHLKKGSIKQIIGRDFYVIKAPALILVLNGSAQSLQEISQNADGHIILFEQVTQNVMFSNKDLLNLLAVEPVIQISKENCLWIDNLNKVLFNEITRDVPNRRIIHGLLQAQLHYILELTNKDQKITRFNEIAISFKNLVYKDYIMHKNVSHYANILGVSENYLNRCSKSTFKKTSKEIIIEISMIHAQLLLWDLTKSISEICYECNVEDPSYFSRIFKKIIGYTPRRYRELFVHDLS